MLRRDPLMSIIIPDGAIMNSVQYIKHKEG